MNKHRGSEFREHLLDDISESDELLFFFLKEAFETSDTKYILSTLGDVVDARGPIFDTIVSRQMQHRYFTGRSEPRISTLNTMLKHLGFKLSIEKWGEK